MRTRLALTCLAATFFACTAPAFAQGSTMTHKETVKQGLKVIEEGKTAKRDGGPSACSLLTRADVKKVTGRDPYEDGTERPLAGGTNCSVGVELLLLSGPDSFQRYENLLKGFKADKDPRKPVSGLGDRAFMLYPEPRNSYQRENPPAVLVVQRGQHTLALSDQAGTGKPADSLQPVLTALMKVALAKLP